MTVFVLCVLVLLGNEVYANLNDSQVQGNYNDSAAHYAARSEPDTSPHEYWKPYKIAEGQNLSRIFKQLDIDTEHLRAIMRADPLAKHLRRIKPGQMINFRYVDDVFAGLEYVVGPTYSLLVLRNGDSFIISEDKKEYDKQVRHASATIDSSLFAAAKNAGMSDRTTMELAKLFGWDIDFALDIRNGDSFSVVYQTLHYDGQIIKDGDILAAEFVNQGKVYRAVKYTDPEGNSGYYNPQGENMHKPFLRTPVDFTRISSHFGYRHHPVLNTMRKHNGVDYVAPPGTVVKSAGDGKIVFRGSLRGYGNTIIVEHGAGYRTLYAHLEKYSEKQRMGSEVKQGQTIGYVGSSGMATGPHLHYEFLVNGAHLNPLTIHLPTAKPINKIYLADFKQKTQTYLAMLPGTSNELVAMNSSAE
ncbi:MAG: peptidoglycan DD-metalloendopeptidase family protein [Gammaproteobacteria bacterium]|nr:peptidoglycan DD-metalloendopeptidase family protein [Gammaproteobacteria bacterium]